MKNPARFSRPGFYTRISAYTFLHESCYMSRQISRQTNFRTNFRHTNFRHTNFRQKSQVAFRWRARAHVRLCHNLLGVIPGRAIPNPGGMGDAPHRNCMDLWLWIPGSARGACARTARSADPSARGPGMTTSRVCDALQLGRVLIKSGQMSALLRKRLNCCTFNGSALAANRCIGPPPTGYRRRRGWRRSEFVTARLSATNGRSLSRPRQRCRSRPGDSILRSSRQDGLRPLQELEYSLAAAQWLAQEQPTPCPRRMSCGRSSCRCSFSTFQ